jgi:mercuric ion transport protein
MPGGCPPGGGQVPGCQETGDKMKKENLSSIGTIIASLLAASCCIGPAVFVVFGTSVGFMGKLAIFAPYRPYFLAAATAMLGFSFWKLYLKKPDCDCAEDIRVKRIARLIFWIGTILFIFAVSFQRLISLIYA